MNSRIIRKSVLIFAATYLMFCFSANAVKIVFVGTSRSGKTILLEMLENPALIAPQMSIFVGTQNPLRRSFHIGVDRVDAMDTPGLFESQANQDGRNNRDLLISVSEAIIEFARGEQIEVIFCVAPESGIKGQDKASLELYRNMLNLLVEAEKIKGFRFTIVITRAENFNEEQRNGMRNEIVLNNGFSNFVPSSYSNNPLQVSDIFFSGCIDPNDFDASHNWNFERALDAIFNNLNYQIDLLKRLGVEDEQVQNGIVLDEDVRLFILALLEEEKKEDSSRNRNHINGLYIETTQEMQRLRGIQRSNAFLFLLIERRTRPERFRRYALTELIRQLIVTNFFQARTAPLSQWRLQPHMRFENPISHPQNEIRLIRDSDSNSDNRDNGNSIRIEEQILPLTFENPILHSQNEIRLVRDSDNNSDNRDRANQSNQPNGNRLIQFALQRPQHLAGFIVLFLATIYGGGSWFNWF